MLDTIITIVGFAILFYFLYNHINKLNKRISALETQLNGGNTTQNTTNDNTSNSLLSIVNKIVPGLITTESNKPFDLSSNRDDLTKFVYNTDDEDVEDDEDMNNIREKIKSITEFIETPSDNENNKKKRGRKKKISL